MTSSPTVVLHAPSIELALAIREHFKSRPSLQQVAVKLLQRELGRLHPDLSINETRPLLEEPVYLYETNGYVLQGHERMTVVDALIERFITDDNVDYSQEQKLINTVSVASGKRMAVDLTDLQTVINQWGPRLIDLYQEALVNYWMARPGGEPARWQWLSTTLKQALQATANHSRDLTTRKRNMIRDVVDIPDNSQRKLSSGVKGYIVDQWGVSGTDSLEMLRGLVVFDRRDSGDTFLLFTLSGGIEIFESFTELGAALLSQFSSLAPDQQMQWRLYEPAGNIFDSFSLTFLAKQLLDIRASVEPARQFDNQYRVLERALNVTTCDFDSVRLSGNRLLTGLNGLLPGWLKHADPDRQRLMSQSMFDLAQSLKAPGWKPFDKDILSLRQFARQALIDQWARDYPHASALDPDGITITIKVNQVLDVPTIGAFWRLPLGYTETTLTLTELSLHSLVGVDAELVSVTSPAGNVPPSIDYTMVRDLINGVNVGKAYPALIKQAMRDDAAQVAWRKASFSEQLRLQLPMLALENTLRYPEAFSFTAYEYVACVLKADEQQRKVAGQSIVLRPLAFKVRDGATPDVVLNMFLIGPQNASAGPHVLYRPMATVKLIEFASLSDVFDAIQHPGPLQYEVLAWLPESARGIYANQGFSAPHFSVFDVIDYVQSLWGNARPSIDDSVVQGDYLNVLYTRTVDAMLTLADQQLVSNMDAFWTWLKIKGGMALNVLLPFVGGPVGAGLGWLLLAWTAIQDVQAIESEDPLDRIEGVADLLLNVGLLLLNISLAVGKVQAPVLPDSLLDSAQGLGPEETIALAWHEEGDTLLEGGAQSQTASENVQLESESSGTDFVSAQPELEQSWEGLYQRLSATRQAERGSFQIRPPLHVELIESGPQRGLFRNKSGLYSQIDGDWYQVMYAVGNVAVTDAQSPFRSGLELASDGAGNWSFAPEDPSSSSRAMEARRLMQLAEEAKRRVDLEVSYSSLFLLFETQTLVEEQVIAAIGQNLPGGMKATLITQETDRMNTAIWRADKLQELLGKRRQVTVVKGFNNLRTRFIAGSVQARRIQVTLLTHKRKFLLTSDLFTPEHFDARQLSEVVVDVRNFGALARKLPEYSALTREAIELCSKAEQQFGEMQQLGKVSDTSLKQLGESTAWSGKRMSTKWKELRLRTLALMCFEPGKARVNDVAFEVIDEVNQLCSLKLMTRLELFTKEHFSREEQLRALNSVLDALLMAEYKLTHQLRILPDYINLKGVDDYRGFVKHLREDVEADLIKAYQQYDENVLPAGVTQATGRPRIMIQTRLRGLVIGNRRALPEGEAHEFEYVDVFERFDHRVVCSFKRAVGDEGATWSQIQRPSKAPSIEKTPYGIWVQAHAEADRLFKLSTVKLQDVARQEQTQRLSPQEVRSEVLRYAQKMLSQRNRLDDAVQAPGVVNKDAALSALSKVLLVNMDTQFAQFMKGASELRNRMAFARLPTSEGLQILYDAGVIDVKEVKVGLTARDVRSGELMRYFEVIDNTRGEVLWVAHFHYTNPASRNAGYPFIRGHLKRYDQRSIGYLKLKQWALTHEDRLNVSRMNVDHEIAAKVIFDGLDDK